MVELRDVDPNETLLDYLRLREGRCGTKEGCAEGDCGACTVVIGTLRDGAIRYQAINSCTALLGMLDGKLLLTVEDLADPGGDLHPVQQALVNHHGSQCGFCTPGFVMSLFALYHSGEALSRARVNDWLAGNLCRCTGYRPIADAAMASCASPPDDPFSRASQALGAALGDLDDNEDLYLAQGERFFAAPASLASLLRLCAQHPQATLVAGATDVGLWITKALRDLPGIVHLGRVRELRRVEQRDGVLCIGAGVTYEDAAPALAAIDPDVGELLRRLGSRQVRSAATVVGNIANGSPIGDMPPLLIALDARIELQREGAARTLELEDFFLDYGRQDRRPAEVLTRVLIPHLREGEVLRCFKLSKRFDQDISAVMGAFRFAVAGERIEHARIAYGGMAATPRRAPRTEAALRGLSLRQAAGGPWQEPLAALAEDFQPIDDQRASAGYRMDGASALLRKALMEVAGIPSQTTRILARRGVR